jgi:hypothetical protein
MAVLFYLNLMLQILCRATMHIYTIATMCIYNISTMCIYNCWQQLEQLNRKNIKYGKKRK